MANKPHSTRHLVILNYIIDFKRRNNGLSPTMRELAEAFHTSTSAITYYLRRLEVIGAIEFYGNTKARSIMIPNSEWRMIPDVQEKDEDHDLKLYVRELADELEQAVRYGWEQDVPEGNRYIRLSDTLTNMIINRLGELISGQNR